MDLFSTPDLCFAILIILDELLNFEDDKFELLYRGIFECQYMSKNIFNLNGRFRTLKYGNSQCFPKKLKVLWRHYAMFFRYFASVKILSSWFSFPTTWQVNSETQISRKDWIYKSDLYYENVDVFSFLQLPTNRMSILEDGRNVTLMKFPKWSIMKSEGNYFTKMLRLLSSYWWMLNSSSKLRTTSNLRIVKMGHLLETLQMGCC